MFPQPVLDDIARGKAFYADLNSMYITQLNNGCCGCDVDSYDCLQGILSSLDDKIELDEYDDVAKKLVDDMLLIIGDYVIKIPPSVNAGPDQSSPVNVTVIFNATITPGSGTIVSILWTQISGTPATLSGANTASLTVSDFADGDSVFKIVVTDSNGLKASDTVRLTGSGEAMRVHYLFQDDDTIPDEATILASSYVTVLTGSDYIVPVANNLVKRVLVFEPSSEISKYRWKDTVDPDNNGLIGSYGTWSEIPDEVGDLRGYITNFKTQFDNSLQFFKGTSG